MQYMLNNLTNPAEGVRLVARLLACLQNFQP
jgi:hypothetical protein